MAAVTLLKTQSMGIADVLYGDLTQATFSKITEAVRRLRGEFVFNSKTKRAI